MATSPNNGLATASMVLGIIAIASGATMFLFAVAAPTGVLAVIFGVIALARSRTLPQRTGWGRAVAGTVCGSLGVALSVVGYFVVIDVFRDVVDQLDIGPYRVEEGRCFVSDGLAMFNGTVTNEAETSRTYTLYIDFVRAGTDNAIASDAVTVRSVQPGESAPFDASARVRVERVDCRVTSVLRVPFSN
jgi:hypothetical protein